MKEPCDTRRKTGKILPKPKLSPPRVVGDYPPDRGWVPLWKRTWVCLHCRTTRRLMISTRLGPGFRVERAEHVQDGQRPAPKCPHCAEVMKAFPWRWRVPKRSSRWWARALEVNSTYVWQNGQPYKAHEPFEPNATYVWRDGQPYKVSE